jgi:methionyl aminopeptidase
VNEEVVHGIPGRRKLKEGDLVSVDIGVLFDGFYADTAVSVEAGSVDQGGRRLMSVTREALRAGINVARAGRRVSDISHAVQGVVEKAGFSVVREFVGHGIGRHMHEDPQIPNYGEPGRGQVLVDGQMLAIEPMVNEGVPGVRILGDGWTAVTADGKRSAHFEHTILVRNGDAEVLTSLTGEA